jgi:myo-inositol-1(or 4)-monophosphatase
VVSVAGWKPWDYAAGSIIAREAGAVMTALDGGPFDLYGTGMVCAGNATMGQLIVETAKI